MNIARLLPIGSTAGALAVIVVVLGPQAVNSQPGAAPSVRHAVEDAPNAVPLEGAQRFFYNGDYGRAAEVTQRLCQARPDDFDACELRTAGLLFQIKKELKDTGTLDKTTAWSLCAGCLVERSWRRRPGVKPLRAHG